MSGAWNERDCLAEEHGLCSGLHRLPLRQLPGTTWETHPRGYLCRVGPAFLFGYLQFPPVPTVDHTGTLRGAFVLGVGSPSIEADVTRRAAALISLPARIITHGGHLFGGLVALL